MRLAAFILALCLSACASTDPFVPMSKEQEAQHKALSAEYGPKLAALADAADNAGGDILEQIDVLYTKRAEVVAPYRAEYHKVKDEFNRKNNAIYDEWKVK